MQAEIFPVPLCLPSPLAGELLLAMVPHPGSLLPLASYPLCLSLPAVKAPLLFDNISGLPFLPFSSCPLSSFALWQCFENTSRKPFTQPPFLHVQKLIDCLLIKMDTETSWWGETSWWYESWHGELTLANLVQTQTQIVKVLWQRVEISRFDFRTRKFLSWERLQLQGGSN